jgi:hypothetical protein
MQPIPPLPIPVSPVETNGYLQLMALVAAAAVAIMFGMMLWRGRPTARERLRLRCPVRLRTARVLFRLAPTGERVDVVRCSVFGRRPISCGKMCLHPAAAPRAA